MVARRWRQFHLALLIGLMGALFSATETGFTLEEEFGLQWLFALRGERPAPPGVFVVGIDRASVTRLRTLPAGREDWPGPLRRCAAAGGLDGLAATTSALNLPRAIHACLIRELRRRGAAVIAYDIAFRPDPARDEGVTAMAAAIREHGGVVLLQRTFRHWLAVEEDRGRGDPPRADTVELPHPELAAVAADIAPFLLPRTTSRVNQVWLVSEGLPDPEQLPVAALQLAARRAADRWAAGAVLDPLGEQHLKAAARLRSAHPFHYLGFYGGPGTIPSIPLASLLAPGPGFPGGAALPDLRGATVFVGLQDLQVPGSEDSFPTVFRSRLGVDLSGVEIAATAYANLLFDGMLRPLPETLRVGLVFLLGSGLAFASFVGSVWRGAALTLALGGAYGAIALGLFTIANVWLPLVVPLMVLLPVALGAGQLAHYLGVARWLGVYAPRQVSRQLLRGDERAASISERREVSVMLTDIVGFTTFAEGAAPEEVTEFLKRHYQVLGSQIEAEDGVLMQFVGDSVMALWGAPAAQPDHALRACRAALAIGRAIDADNARRKTTGQPPVRLRIGINTGDAVVGYVGTPDRGFYGAVGDTVNTTQRIEELVKTLILDRPSAGILVSERTRAQAESRCSFEDVGAHLLRGRERPERVFRLTGERRRK